jgi:hypothetical protein
MSSILLKIGILGLLISTLAGCQTAISTSLENESSRKATPTDLESIDYKIQGCNIPLPQEKKQFVSKVSELKDVKGKRTKITETVYHPTGEFVFTPSESVMMQEPYNILNRGKTNVTTFRLTRLNEFKIKDKIFGYSFTGQEILSQEDIEAAKPYNATYLGLFGFTCYDFSGDGNFEYINGPGKLAETIPDWATR